jgi:hypothetical protein
MAVKRIARPRAKAQLTTGTLGTDPAQTSRLLSDLADAHDDLDARVRARDVQTVNLTVGANRLNHGLGRKALGCTITPTVADPTWAWAMTAADDKQLTITTVGVPQPNAYLEIF